MKMLAAALSLFALAPSASARDERETLTQAVNKVSELDSYTWKGESEFQTPLGGSSGQIPTFEATYQKDLGLYLKSERGELFRKGSRILVKPANGEWQDLANFRPPARPAPQGGGDKPNPPNRNRGRAASLVTPMMLRALKAPHDELKDLAKGLKEVKKSEKAEKIGDIECFEYSGELSEEAMKAAPLGRMLGRFGGTNASVSGSAKIWVDVRTGLVALYEVDTKASVDFQGNVVDLTLTRRNEIADAGKAKLEVPEAVQKLLSAEPKAEADKGAQGNPEKKEKKAEDP